MSTIDNPFSVETPELMSAEEIIDLFVPLEESYSLEVSGHVFLHGHRGSGKSMMFRRLAPDCQSLLQSKPVSDLNFFGVYVSIKKTDIDLIDYSVIDNPTAKSIISEHVLVCFLISKLLSAIKNHCQLSKSSSDGAIKNFFKKDFLDLLLNSGYEDNFKSNLDDIENEYNLLDFIIKKVDDLFIYHVRYLRKLLAGLGQHLEYSGPLLGYYDFFIPVIEKIKALPFMPNGPIYILIDDVDNLNIAQTKVLNTWVSYRTTDVVSFKLATQMNYKTLSTTSGRRIETPHDYKEIYYSNVYTGSKKEKYPDWVREITAKRLQSFYKKKFGYLDKIDPEKYFPVDKKQQLAIDEIAEKYLTGELETKGFRKADDAYRYARPDYIVSLGGSRKSGSTYKYAGFQQLVHISSGVIRHFLEPASKMFALQERDAKNELFLEISPSNQNKVIREEADKLLFTQMDKIIHDMDNAEEEENDARRNSIQKLRNLITSIGSLFYSAMKSDKSERRVFSFALSDPENLSKELKSILDMGVQEGFLYETFIGTKEGIGRTRLYVLTRRLAPIFKLDPIGFSAYKFVTCSFLETSLSKPKTIINKLNQQGIDATLEEPNFSQEKLF
ncbi:hypothetical protein ADINL_0083 [Nitrincola lacisaponensis]|uniref:Uncharacterized protein n=1 Tax=Nitrincola lacisaponensis TaxID=267850 RepID=A0A063Y508_9GAMM|nr:hypothetical protein [Nitrincola lacisaponensis]KDE41403.1 hypothetical protein ADINL_0083 [Nitrincola lacisaponensis]